MGIDTRALPVASVAASTRATCGAGTSVPPNSGRSTRVPPITVSTAVCAGPRAMSKRDRAAAREFARCQEHGDAGRAADAAAKQRPRRRREHGDLHGEVVVGIGVVGVEAVVRDDEHIRRARRHDDQDVVPCRRSPAPAATRKSCEMSVASAPMLVGAETKSQPASRAPGTRASKVAASKVGLLLKTAIIVPNVSPPGPLSNSPSRRRRTTSPPRTPRSASRSAVASGAGSLFRRK
jgi:hypothetical protein